MLLCCTKSKILQKALPNVSESREDKKWHEVIKGRWFVICGCICQRLQVGRYKSHHVTPVALLAFTNAGILCLVTYCVPYFQLCFNIFQVFLQYSKILEPCILSLFFCSVQILVCREINETFGWNKTCRSKELPKISASSSRQRGLLVLFL